jgi:hypothetical protein
MSKFVVGFVAVSCLLTTSAIGQNKVGEASFKVRDTEGRETANVLAKGLTLALPDSEGAMFDESSGLSLKIDNSYLVCIPFSRIKSGERGGKDEFAVQLSSATGNAPVRGSLSPADARITGKFELAGMTGDFVLAQQKLSSIVLVSDAPGQKGEDASFNATATITLTNGKELPVTDVQRHEIHYVSSRYINISGYHSQHKEKDIVLVQGESELKIPFVKIKELVFHDKKVSLTLLDGTSLQFDSISQKEGDTTDGFAARSALGSIYVTPDKVQKITFGMTETQQPKAR